MQQRSKGLILSTAMVQAFLAGDKTQTIKLCRPEHYPTFTGIGASRHSSKRNMLAALAACPYVQPDSPVYIKESWTAYAKKDMRSYSAFQNEIARRFHAPDGLSHWLPVYQATDNLLNSAADEWLPPTTMTRWASRIELACQSLRLVRMSELTEQDMLREGLSYFFREYADRFPKEYDYKQGSLALFRQMWDSIYSTHLLDIPALSEDNPYLWLIEFDMEKLKIRRELPLDYKRARDEARRTFANVRIAVEAYASMPEFAQFSGSELFDLMQAKQQEASKCRH